MRSLVLRISTIFTGMALTLGSVALAAAQVPTTLESSVTFAPASATTAPALSFDDQQRPYRRPTPLPGPGARLFGAVDVEHMFAPQSFSAVVGTATLFGFGAGVDFTGLASALFVRVAVSDMPKSGTRSNGSSFSNGIAESVKMIPVDLAVGWRFNHATRTNNATPYIGGGALILHYSEVTPSGTSADNTISTFFGYEAFVGVDFRYGHSVTLAPEVDLRAVPGAIGKGGVSQVFNESNLGGATFRVTIGVTLGRR